MKAVVLSRHDHAWLPIASSNSHSMSKYATRILQKQQHTVINPKLTCPIMWSPRTFSSSLRQISFILDGTFLSVTAWYMGVNCVEYVLTPSSPYARIASASVTIKINPNYSSSTKLQIVHSKYIHAQKWGETTIRNWAKSYKEVN